METVEGIEANGMLDEELGKLVGTLIDNKEVKEFLTKMCQLT
jgi:hypothetical protein